METFFPPLYPLHFLHGPISPLRCDILTSANRVPRQKGTGKTRLAVHFINGPAKCHRSLEAGHPVCLFHLIQRATRPAYRADNAPLARTRAPAERVRRGSFIGIAPVQDSFAPPALNLSTRFILTRIDRSAPLAGPLPPFPTSQRAIFWLCPLVEPGVSSPRAIGRVEER